MRFFSLFGGHHGGRNRMLAGNLTHRCVDDVRHRTLRRMGQLPLDEARGYLRARARSSVARRMRGLVVKEQLSLLDAVEVQRLALDACVQVLLPQFVAPAKTTRRAA